jgi:hypothetical protein
MQLTRLMMLWAVVDLPAAALVASGSLACRGWRGVHVRQLLAWLVQVEGVSTLHHALLLRVL